MKIEQTEEPRSREHADCTHVDGIAVAWGLGYTFDGPHRPGKVSGWMDAGKLKINGVEYSTYGEIRSYVARQWAEDGEGESREVNVPVTVFLQLRRVDNFGDPTEAARAAARPIAEAIRGRVQALTANERAMLAEAACEREAERCEAKAADLMAEAATYRGRRGAVSAALAEALEVTE